MMLFNSVEMTNTAIKSKDGVREYNCAESCLLNLQEINSEWYNVTKKTITLESKALNEDNSTLLTLSIKNFFEQIIVILKRMQTNLKKFWTQFKSYAKEFDQKNIRLFKKYEVLLLKKDLKKFKTSSRKYTISNKIPNLNVKDDFLKDFTFDKVNNINDSDLIKLESDLETFADKFRAKVINKHGSILKEDFIKELELVYRGDEHDVVKVEFRDGTSKTQFLNYIRDFNKDLDELDKVKTSINSFYETVIGYFNNFVRLIEREGDKHVLVRSTNGKNITVSSDRYNLLSTYGEYKSRMCKTALSIYNLAFSMKLDAYKERNNRFKEILLEALNFSNDGEQYTLSIMDDSI